MKVPLAIATILACLLVVLALLIFGNETYHVWKGERFSAARHSSDARRRERDFLRMSASRLLEHRFSHGIYPNDISDPSCNLWNVWLEWRDLFERLNEPVYYISPGGRSAAVVFPSEDGKMRLRDITSVACVATETSPDAAERLHVLRRSWWSKRSFSDSDMFIYVDSDGICRLNAWRGFDDEQSAGIKVYDYNCETHTLRRIGNGK